MYKSIDLPLQKRKKLSAGFERAGEQRGGVAERRAGPSRGEASRIQAHRLVPRAAGHGDGGVNVIGADRLLSNAGIAGLSVRRGDRRQ